VFAFAAVARLFHLDHVPHRDELNHVLAARALLENGTLEIVAGAEPYTRAAGFTYLVAGMFRVFGESLITSRIPALVCGVLLVLLLFLWVRSEAGRAGAWVAALLLTFAPISLQLSQWSRFYTLHALLILAACMLVYYVILPRPARTRERILLGMAAFLCLAFAFHLQITTLIGAAGLGLWVLLVGGPEWVRRLQEPGRRRMAVGLMVAGAIAVTGALALSGFVDFVWQRAAYVDDWAEARSAEAYFYHYRMLGLYPPLWSLFPVAVVLALATRFRAAMLCVCVFGVAFVAHSLVAWKTERYIFYALPFFFAIWGIATAGALNWFQGRIETSLGNAGIRSPVLKKVGVAAIFCGIILFGAFSSQGAFLGYKMMTVGDADWQWAGYRGHPDWVAAADATEPLIQGADVVVASYDVTALYAVGRLDFMLRSAGAGESDEGVAFGYRTKSAASTINSPRALEQVMECYGSGLVFIDGGHYGRSWAVDEGMVDVLEARSTRLVTPDPQMYVYYWEGVGSGEGDCEVVPAIN